MLKIICETLTISYYFTQLPQVEIKDHPGDNTFELIDKVGGHSLSIAAHRDQTKQLWLKEIREFANDVGKFCY